MDNKSRNANAGNGRVRPKAVAITGRRTAGPSTSGKVIYKTRISILKNQLNKFQNIQNNKKKEIKQFFYNKVCNFPFVHRSNKIKQDKIHQSNVINFSKNTSHLWKYVKQMLDTIFSTNINVENKAKYLNSIITNSSKNFYHKLNQSESLKQFLEYIYLHVVDRLLKGTEITRSTIITHILGNKLTNYNNKKQKLDNIHKKSRSSSVSGEPPLEINFSKSQTKEFKKLLIMDVIHDNKSGNLNVSKLSNVLSSFGFINNNIENLQVINKNGIYKKNIVNTIAKLKVQDIFKNSIKIKIPKLQPHPTRNGKNLIRYKLTTNNGSIKKFYKTFNVLLDSNTNSTINKFVRSLYLTKNNRKIASHILCPAQLLDPGIYKSPLNPLGTLIAKLEKLNSPNVVILNSKRLKVELSFDEGKEGNKTRINLEIDFDSVSRIFQIKKIKNNTETLIKTTSAKNAKNSNTRVSKFLGDFMMILKVISDTKKNNKPIAFGTIDNNAVLIYKFLCDVVEVKPRIFFTRAEGSYNELYIYGMDDIISKECEKTSKNDRKKRKRTSIINSNNKIKRGNNNVNASNSNNNNRLP